jgi:outer membrane protein
MKNLIEAVVVLGITIFGLSGTAISQTKIGYINTEELIGSMPEAEKANAELQEYQSALQQQGTSYLTELNELDSLFARDSAKMNKATKDLKRNDMIAWYKKGQGWNQTMQQKLVRNNKSCVPLFNAKPLTISELWRKKTGTILSWKQEHSW